MVAFAISYTYLLSAFGDQVPSFYVSVPAVLALYSSGRTGGVVFDSGYGASHTVPVYEGCAVHHAIEKLNVAGQDLTQHMVLLMTKTGHSFTGGSERELVRDIKERLGYVALDFEQEIKKARSSSAIEKCYKLPDGQVIILGMERFQVTEPLFQPALVQVESPGIHDCAYEPRQEISRRKTKAVSKPRRLTMTDRLKVLEAAITGEESIAFTNLPGDGEEWDDERQSHTQKENVVDLRLVLDLISATPNFALENQQFMPFMYASRQAKWVQPFSARLPMELTIVDHLPPLPSSDLVNELIQIYFSGQGLRRFSWIHKATFLKNPSSSPLILFSVLLAAAATDPRPSVYAKHLIFNSIRNNGMMHTSSSHKQQRLEWESEDSDQISHTQMPTLDEFFNPDPLRPILLSFDVFESTLFLIFCRVTEFHHSCLKQGILPFTELFGEALGRLREIERLMQVWEDHFNRFIAAPGICSLDQGQKVYMQIVYRGIRVALNGPSTSMHAIAAELLLPAGSQGPPRSRLTRTTGDDTSSLEIVEMLQIWSGSPSFVNALANAMQAWDFLMKLYEIKELNEFPNPIFGTTVAQVAVVFLIVATQLIYTGLSADDFLNRIRVLLSHQDRMSAETISKAKPMLNFLACFLGELERGVGLESVSWAYDSSMVEQFMRQFRVTRQWNESEPSNLAVLLAR
ncbi:actin [Gonapodya sp. JEL0774]|nr:actin [Gonapodya sp. JEL0774]